MNRRQQTAITIRNQKMDRQPRLSERAPPMAGAMQGEIWDGISFSRPTSLELLVSPLVLG